MDGSLIEARNSPQQPMEFETPSVPWLTPSKKQEVSPSPMDIQTTVEERVSTTDIPESSFPSTLEALFGSGDFGSASTMDSEVDIFDGSLVAMPQTDALFGFNFYDANTYSVPSLSSASNSSSDSSFSSDLLTPADGSVEYFNLPTSEACAPTDFYGMSVEEFNALLNAPMSSDISEEMVMPSQPLYGADLKLCEPVSFAEPAPRAILPSSEDLEAFMSALLKGSDVDATQLYGDFVPQGTLFGQETSEDPNAWLFSL